METLVFILLVGAAQLSTAKVLKCYTGMVQNGEEVPGMKIKQVDCTFGMDQCATVNYEFNVLGFPVKATQAMCSSSFLGCQICSTIKNPALNILKCNANCCDSDSCNNDVASFKLPKKKDSVMCYVGQVFKFPMAEKLNPGNVSLSRCPGTTKCITVDYTMLTYGLHIPVVQGICGINVLACDMFCDYIKRGISGFTEISSCKSMCCEGDRCNKQVGQFYRGRK